jgi:peptidyl-prolyl cis-trans isomerase C
MIFTLGSRLCGTRVAATVVAATLFATTAVNAETIASVNGKTIDSVVADLYIQSRTNRPANQASAQERELLMGELKDIYILSTQDIAKEVVDDPSVKAQLELQQTSLVAQNVASKFYDSVLVTDEEIQKEYEKQITLSPNMQFKARHILVESQGEAVALIEQLADGADFEELAKANSTGPSGPSGGDLGWFSPDQMVAPFSAAVAQLEDGAVTAEPVQTQFGWHVILREESRAAEPPTLEASTESITRKIQNDKFQTYLEQLRAESSE